MGKILRVWSTQKMPSKILKTLQSATASILSGGFPLFGSKYARKRLDTMRRFHKDDKGAAAIEMALVAAPFIAVIFAILESGIVYFSEFALEKKVAEAARVVRTGQIEDSNTNLAAFKNTICNEVSVLFDCANLVVDVRSFSDFKTLADTGLPDAIDGSRNVIGLNGWDTGAEQDVVVVRVFYEWNLLLPGGITQMDNLSTGKRLISASAVFRNEPFNAIQ